MLFVRQRNTERGQSGSGSDNGSAAISVHRRYYLTTSYSLE